MPALLRLPTPLHLFMTADAVGGVWSYALDLARGLASHGVETTLAVLGPAPDPDQRTQAEAVAGLRLRVTGLPLDWIAESPKAVEEAGAAVAALAAEARADLVHLNNPALAAGARWSAPVAAACHSCVATWWQTVRSGPLPAEFAWRTDLVQRGYRRADALLAPTAAFALATARTYGLAAPPAVVHNGRRPPSVPAASRPRDLVFTAGRLWDEGKNLTTLDRAAARLSVPVLAAGPLQGPNGAGIELKHIQALGRLPEAEIALCLASSPVFVSVARYEPFGLAVLEAAQAGCALVLSDIPTFRELWNGAAEFVAPADETALAAAIEMLFRDPVRRTRLGASARERSRRYTVEAMAAATLASYQPLVVGGKAVGRQEVAA